jgi:hypothetical protein
MYRKTLQWHQPAIYAVLLFNVIIYAIVAMIVRKSARVEFALCKMHQARRRRRILITWTIVLAGLATLIYGIYDAANSRSSDSIGPLSITGGILILLAGAIYGIYAVRVLYPKKIDANFVWIGGASPAYIDSVAPLSQ